MIVVDVGCARYGGDYSIERLVEWYKPEFIYGFDPNAVEYQGPVQLAPTTQFATPPGVHWNTLAIISPWAAWIYNGEVSFAPNGMVGHITDGEAGDIRVPCFDLAEFLDELPEGEIVLKLDCEGAEYELLEHLIETGAEARLSRLIVEWHPRGEGPRRHAIEMALSCPVEQWRW